MMCSTYVEHASMHKPGLGLYDKKKTSRQQQVDGRKDRCEIKGYRGLVYQEQVHG